MQQSTISRNFNSGRFAYSMGYKSREAAIDAFNNLCAEGEMSPCEGRIERYTVCRDGKKVTRFAITVEG